VLRRPCTPSEARTAVITNARAGRGVTMDSRPVNGGADGAAYAMTRP
jgi:hypothetical protein